MLKLAGCICILLASCGMAYSLVTGLRKQISQTEALLDFFTAMEGEIVQPLSAAGAAAAFVQAPAAALSGDSCSGQPENGR